MMKNIPKKLSRPSARRKVKEQLLRMLDPHIVDMKMISGLAGDRELSKREQTLLEDLEKKREKAFYSDILFVVSHKYFPAEKAKRIWTSLLKHKADMTEKLDRNPGVAVAALDYLTNVTNLMNDMKVISEGGLATVAQVALRDGMTGLFEHATFDAKLNAEVKRFERYGNRLAVIMIDIDNFKRVNDTRGHAFGDTVLHEIGDILRSEIRELDVAARYGGEEFVLMLPRTGTTEAFQIAERIRLHVEHRFMDEEGITISLGVANCPKHGKTDQSLLLAADKALYESKKSGRNCSTLAVE